MVVVREGRIIALALTFIGLILYKLMGVYYALPLWLLALVSLYLYRDPDRTIPPIPLAVVSPVDGTIESVKNIYDPYTDRQAIAVRIRMASWNCYSLRSPIEGKLLQQWFYLPGDGKDAPHLDMAQRNDDGRHYVMWLQTDEQDDVVIVLEIPNKLHKLACYSRVGERIGQGQRCGMLRLGGHIEVFLPDNARLEVAQGQRLTSGMTILARLIHK